MPNANLSTLGFKALWGFVLGLAYGPNSLWSSGGWSHAELVWGLLGAH